MPSEKKKSLRENVFKGNWDGAARVKKNKLSVGDEISRRFAHQKQPNKFDHLLRSQVLYIREPDDKWMKEDSKDCFVLSSADLIEPAIHQNEPTQRRAIVEKKEEKRQEEKKQEEKRQEEKIQEEKKREQIRVLERPKLVYLTDGILDHIPSLTYNQKMKNWFDMNKQTTLNDTNFQTSRLQGIYTNPIQTRGHDFAYKMKQERMAQERSARLGLMARFKVNTEESARTSTLRTLPETKYRSKDKTNKETTVVKDEDEIKYTRLADGFLHVKGDFENAKRNLGVTKEGPTQQELKQERWDMAIQQHLQEKIEAGKKGYVPASVLEEERNKMKAREERFKSPPQALTQDEIIQGLKDKIKEISLKISNAPHSSKYPTKPNEYTVEDLKCMLDSQCKTSVTKYSIEEFRAVLKKLGFHNNVVNYKALVDKLNNVAIRTYGRPLQHKHTQQYLKHESKRLIAEQELDNIRQTGSTISIRKKINGANKNVGTYLQRMKVTDRRLQRTPVLHLFNQTYNNIRENKDKVVVQGPKSFKGKKRIKEADEFWKKYGRGKGKLPDMNRYKLELENKHQNKMVSDLTTGFTSKLKEEYPLIFQNDTSLVKLTQNFTTPDLITAMNRILHQPVPLHQMMDSYDKKIDSIRVKHPRLFHTNN